MRIHWPRGFVRGTWPVEFGLPLPEGRFPSLPSLRLEAAGETFPVQVRGAARWPDGSWRWVHLTAMAPADPRGGASPARLRSGVGPVREAVRIRRVAGGVEVTAAGVRYRAPAAGGGLLEAFAEKDGTRLWGPLTAAMELHGRRLTAGKPDRVEVIEDGPLRASVVLSGRYGADVVYELRLRFYGGTPVVRLWHRFAYTGEEAFAPLSGLGLTLPAGSAAAGPAHTRVGAETMALAAGERVVQLDESTVVLRSVRRSDRAAGWIAARGKGGRWFGIAVPWFWQQYPQALGWQDGAIRYDPWAPEGGATLAGVGAAKTHELAIWTGTGGLPQALPVQWPLAALSPQWTASTRALPYLPAKLESQDVSAFLARLRHAFQKYVERNASERWDEAGHVDCPGGGTPAPGERERPRTGAYGMWNWGDWNFPGYHDRVKGCDAWGNLEYDTPLVLALGFAATGDPEMGRMAAVAARHFADVDTIHGHPRHPEWVGMNHPKNPRHFSFALGTVDLGHTWTEGLLAWWYLIGDEHGLEAARGIADHLVRRLRGGIAGGNPRQWGWPAIALVGAWEATGEARYLEAAREYARRGMAAWPPDPARGWKTGILADALIRLEGIEPDPQRERWLRRYARATLERSPKDIRFFPAVAWLGAAGRDSRAGAAALGAVRRLRPGTWGKPLTIRGRYGFRVLQLLADGSVRPR